MWLTWWGIFQAEKLLAELQFRYDQVQDSLEEQGGVASQQVKKHLPLSRP